MVRKKQDPTLLKCLCLLEILRLHFNLIVIISHNQDIGSNYKVYLPLVANPMP